MNEVSESDIRIIAQKVKNDGVVLKKNWLDKKTINRMKNVLDSSMATCKGNLRGIYSTKPKQFLRDLVSLDFVKFYNSLYLLKINKKLNLKKIAQEILNADVDLMRIDGYISEVSEESIIPWHQDQAFSGKHNVKKENYLHPSKGLIKFNFFLTDADFSNGGFAYIPKSHRVTIAHKTALFDNIIDYEPFWSLPDFRKIVIKHRELLKNNIGNEYLDFFLEQTQFLSTCSDTDVFDISAESGSAIIFDEHGFHRASAPTLNNRYLIRFIYRRKT